MANVYDAKVAIVGAGSAGISIAARLLRKNRQLHGQVLLIDPSDKHYYQSLWTLVGGGAAKVEDSVREQASLIPEGAKWLKEAVYTFSPENNTLETKEGSTVRYDYLVVAAGIEIYWDQIKGLKETIGKNGVCSNYSYDYVQSTWENIRNFRGGTAIFTQPSTPVKCGGAPQKIMYLADDYFRQSGVREHTNIIFASGLPNIFAVKRYADTLEQVIQRKNIETKYRVELVEIDGDTKKATFEHLFFDEQLAHMSYLVGCQRTGEAIVIDPGRNIDWYIDTAKKEGLQIVAATETHIHADFVSGAKELVKRCGAKLYLSDEGDENWKYEYLDEVDHELVKEGSVFTVGNVEFQVLHTPGHTPEHVSFILTDKGGGATKPMGIFTGDFVFVGDVGRPDLLEKAAGVSGTADVGARQMFESLKKFKALPDYLQV
ncbi:MBL fold metallo-hydrolase [Geobacillus proteiniphilus]|uniref:MBL fold metallo-hydrolase n=1 Tax=Geobacillus proteiniphilus TaxID=860353 RepID=UPI001EFBED43|nr:MBL fold metallo-hydrolase [Geobacillus proteiniphilus]